MTTSAFSNQSMCFISLFSISKFPESDSVIRLISSTKMSENYYKILNLHNCNKKNTGHLAKVVKSYLHAFKK